MIALRRAEVTDCERVWQINFAPEARAVSTSQEVVPYGAHAQWFARRLAEASSPLWMIEDAGEIVGVVRVDPLDRGQCGRISIALDGQARGRGVGRRAIGAACHRWGRTVVAEIHADNQPSIACFTACGFVPRGDAHPSTHLISFIWSPA